MSKMYLYIVHVPRYPWKILGAVSVEELPKIFESSKKEKNKIHGDVHEFK